MIHIQQPTGKPVLHKSEMQMLRASLTWPLGQHCYIKVISRRMYSNIIILYTWCHNLCNYESKSTAYIQMFYQCRQQGTHCTPPAAWPIHCAQQFTKPQAHKPQKMYADNPCLIIADCRATQFHLSIIGSHIWFSRSIVPAVSACVCVWPTSRWCSFIGAGVLQSRLSDCFTLAQMRIHAHTRAHTLTLGHTSTWNLFEHKLWFYATSTILDAIVYSPLCWRTFARFRHEYWRLERKQWTTNPVIAMRAHRMQPFLCNIVLDDQVHH